MPTPEEIFERQVWEVLQRIWEEKLATVEGSPVKYSIPNVVGNGVIWHERRIKIIQKLEEFGALKILRNSNGQRIGESDLYYLVINIDCFRTLYKKYENKYQLTSWDNSDIDEWLKTKDKWAVQKIWQVVSAINSEWQLRDNNTFRIPLDKFERARVTNQNDLEAILTSLDKRKVIEVTRKLGETPPTDDPNKPQGSVWTTIAETPSIVNKHDTQLKLFEDRFQYLATKLKKLVGNGSVEKMLSDEGVTTAEWREDFAWNGENAFVFGEYGEVTFNSPERKKLFELLTKAKGEWVTITQMEKEVKKDAKEYIRSTLGQIENQFSEKLKKYISIPSTKDDRLTPKPKQGAYRIKYSPEPQHP